MDYENASAARTTALTRRTVLGGTAMAGLATIAGCLGDDGDVPEPIAIADDQACDNCTMAIGQHPGPVGQTHYEQAADVVGEDRPAQFCSSLCTYTHTFEQDAEPQGIYLTDYSSVDWSVSTDDGELEISNHLERDAFAQAGELALVVDSEVLGSMGGSMIGFRDADDADDFQAEYGGDRYDHEDVTPELVMSLM
ncbi:nitrous oxide reductase accessory protein NosL [Salinadaptatus halalkaliphilus]|uniref:Nitrous oxide reductase accessory protein NosL n=1 Tax=Salinadaptatus halalkaliphilus TaxID=2419781 RepID=A0A4S3TM73_9EURY|nr:nitrous oxide reductase accessory protein NosL [Salinadaptatus halalkaliphilus]THE64710.1 nitrous oxide reductase accessory protein NosL [Salinadaptatus halalkaliphilus]